VKAGEIVKYLNSEDTEEAVKVLVDEVLPTTGEVISFLEHMNTSYGTLLADKTH
jgi:hypothetical protein